MNRVFLIHKVYDITIFLQHTHRRHLHIIEWLMLCHLSCECGTIHNLAVCHECVNNITHVITQQHRAEKQNMLESTERFIGISTVL